MAEPVTVTVDATWRMSRVEFSQPYSESGSITGYGEVLLQEPAEPSPGAAILRNGTPSPFMAEQKTYGTMPGGVVGRSISSVMEETVEIDGGTLVLSFAQVFAAMEAFLVKWRAEDQSKPTGGPLEFPNPSVSSPAPVESFESKSEKLS